MHRIASLRDQNISALKYQLGPRDVNRELEMATGL